MDKSEIINFLREVIDPEIGENIVDLGIVRDVKINEKIIIKILPTSPFCPLLDLIIEMIKMKVREKISKEVEVEVSDEEWKPEYMSKAVSYTHLTLPTSDLV